jgi:5-methylcytosine-specific restriction endonuclease McrA
VCGSCAPCCGLWQYVSAAGFPETGTHTGSLAAMGVAMPRRPPSYAMRLAARQGRSVLVDRRSTQRRRVRFGPDPRNTWRWTCLRAHQLTLAPLCADPYAVHRHGHYLAPATEVDHIVGIWEAPDLVWELSNLQSLCHACHVRKSAAERKTSCSSR